MLCPNLCFNLILRNTDNTAPLKEISLPVITHQQTYIRNKTKNRFILRWEESTKQGGSEGGESGPEPASGPLRCRRNKDLPTFPQVGCLIHLFTSNTSLFKSVYCISGKDKTEPLIPFHKKKKKSQKAKQTKAYCMQLLPLGLTFSIN